jgi:hypothetical protein
VVTSKRSTFRGIKGPEPQKQQQDIFRENVFYNPNYRGPAYWEYGYEDAAGRNRDVKTVLTLDSLVALFSASKARHFPSNSSTFTTADLFYRFMNPESNCERPETILFIASASGMGIFK